MPTVPDRARRRVGIGRGGPHHSTGRRGSWSTRATSWLLALGALTSACCGPIASLYPPRGDEVGRRVWVVRHDWHTGLVLRREDVPADVWPERDDFSGAEYLDVGWGDRDFYRAPRGSLWLGLKAAFWANDSVLHVAAFSAPPAVYFAGREVAEIGLSIRGFRALAAFIADAHARTGEGRAILLGPGTYGDSRFYLGRERYVLTTCNVWTARALRAGGFPITPFWAITAANVMLQVESGLGVAAPGGGRPSAPGPPPPVASAVTIPRSPSVTSASVE